MKPTVTARRILPWLTLALAFAAGEAPAGSFQVNPIRIEIAKGATTAAIVVRNDGEDAIVIQANVVGWTQEDGQDVYAPTTEALVTPPVMTVPAGGEQIVRVGLRRRADPQHELTYRVYLQEVPPPPKPGFTGLQVALRVGLPVFVPPVALAVRRLEWSTQVGPDGAIRLAAQNTGNTHVQVTDFVLAPSSAGEPLAHESTLAYVLAGQRRVWTLAAAPERVKPGSELRLKAYTDAGEIDTAITVER
ncbi:MAG TPA: fimbria/pilus periplasmic chaperone [Casimicrobiaceae bacterium]|jgi:fimbrial chaperone protein|nr:fimbria/pilus periplasmic chaperone [Casimicrobiaceae bacterium]